VVPHYPEIQAPNLHLVWLGGFYPPEHSSEEDWHWSMAQGELCINNLERVAKSVRLDMTLRAVPPGMASLRIESDLFTEVLDIAGRGRAFSKVMALPPGQHFVKFSSTAPETLLPGDVRPVAFQVVNFRLESCAAPLAQHGDFQSQ
jgi:hypothetical protein